jgi:Pectinacetylesterase
VVPGGDCKCADGSELAVWERRADPTKVVFFLDGGGVCFDATSCAFSSEEPAYDWNVRGDDPSEDDGIFDFARADNPFLDYGFISVPSCTGDMHLGDATREYSPKLTVEHNGFVNGTAALSYLAEHYPDAAQVVVVGKSVGSVAAPVYGGLVADKLPNARVTVFGAQSGHIPDDPDLNAKFLGELWGAYTNMPDWEVNEGLTDREWGPPRFWIQAGLHNPKIVLARFRPTPSTAKRRRGGVDWSGSVEAPRRDRRQRGGDRGRRGRPAQLHRARPRPRDPRMAKVLRDEGQRRKAGRLGDQADRGRPVDDVHGQTCRVR